MFSMFGCFLFYLLSFKSGETHTFLSEHDDLLLRVQKRMGTFLAVRLHSDEVIFGKIHVSRCDFTLPVFVLLPPFTIALLVSPVYY